MHWLENQATLAGAEPSTGMLFMLKILDPNVSHRPARSLYTNSEDGPPSDRQHIMMLSDGYYR
jgi:hypothetical protein